MDPILDLAVLLGEDSDEDVDDAFALHIIHENENLGNRGLIYGHFNLEDLTNLECKNIFRFTKIDLPRLSTALGIPETITTRDRVTVPGVHGLCVLLRRLAYPNRLIDLEPLFGLCSKTLSNICNQMISIIFNNKGHLFDNLGNNPHLNLEKLREYSQAITRKGCPLPNCWGFIDGTARPICRPSINQELYYSGHKRMHCVKYQSVICPDGICISLKGAYEGRRHDAGIFRDSGLYEELEQNVVFNNENFLIYGDQAYSLRELLLRPYTAYEIGVDADRQNFNNLMSVLRIAVEWGFNKIIQEFAFLDFKKNQRILLQDVESMYKVAMILTNCHTCLYGSETSAYFDIDPPILEHYLG